MNKLASFEIWRSDNKSETLMRVSSGRQGATRADAIRLQAERFPSLYPDGKIVYVRKSGTTGPLHAYRIRRGGLMVERA